VGYHVNEAKGGRPATAKAS